MQVLFVAESDMQEEKRELSNFFKHVPPVQGIKGAHCVKRVGNLQVLLYENIEDVVAILIL